MWNFNNNSNGNTLKGLGTNINVQAINSYWNLPISIAIPIVPELNWQLSMAIAIPWKTAIPMAPQYYCSCLGQCQWFKSQCQWFKSQCQWFKSQWQWFKSQCQYPMSMLTSCHWPSSMSMTMSMSWFSSMSMSMYWDLSMIIDFL